MKPWRLAGRVIGDGLKDGVGQPLQRVEDVECKKCHDFYNSQDIHKGKCFQCRYLHHIKTGCRLYIRGSDIASETESKFPVQFGYKESLDGQPINLEINP